MAQATTKVAPSKSGLSKEDQILERLGIELDPTKRYVFELANKNAQRESPIINMRTHMRIDNQEFKPYQNIVMSSQIVWNGARTNLRYYDGCDTIFASDQTKDRESIEQFIKSTTRRSFENGRVAFYGYDKMLIVYMLATSWNAESPFRTRTANPIFILLDENKKFSAEEQKLDMMEKAIQYAKEATENKMLIHANYLELPTLEESTGNELTPAAIRTLYRRKAMESPKEFIESYGNKSIEMKYYINKALSSGVIVFNKTPNKATMGGFEICDISGLKSQEGVAAKLLEFSQLAEGEDFVIQLRALYN